jgi:hypothetical protein
MAAVKLTDDLAGRDVERGKKRPGRSHDTPPTGLDDIVYAGVISRTQWIDADSKSSSG